jgi:transposase
LILRGAAGMQTLVMDELWATVEPLLPRRRVRRKGGRPRVDDRAVLAGILFVLRSGIPWSMLPLEIRCGSGVTCWRRLREWQRWGRLEAAAPHAARPARGGGPDRLDTGGPRLEEPARERGAEMGRNPTDKGKPGSKQHLVVDAQGIPLAVEVTAADLHDRRMLERMLDAIPPIRTWRRGRPRRRPKKLHSDKGYDYSHCRRACRRLTIRCERLVAMHRAFLYLACALIC